MNNPYSHDAAKTEQYGYGPGYGRRVPSVWPGYGIDPRYRRRRRRRPIGPGPGFGITPGFGIGPGFGIAPGFFIGPGFGRRYW